jgi:dihydrodipicolinate synthase/N-acetylneuraminate lyase
MKNRALKNRHMKGVITAIITPFDKSGGLDAKAIKEITAFLKKKVHGLFINGTFGSGPLMSVGERKKVLELVLEEANDDVEVCVNISTTSKKWAHELAKHAADSGATCIISTAPYYYKHRADIVEKYFVELIEKSEIPVYIYDNPSVVPFKCSPELLLRLAQKGLKGMKDSSKDLVSFYKNLTVLDETDFRCIMGTDSLLLPAVVMGAPGCVSATSNYLTDLVVNLWEKVKKGDLKEGEVLQKKVIRVKRIIEKYPQIPLLQKIMREMGLNAGYPRAPFEDTPEDIWKDVKNGLEGSGIKLL